MSAEMSPVFITYASDMLGETSLGLTGPQIAKLTAARAIEWSVKIPHPSYPFAPGVSNKRTALFENLMAFSQEQRYKLIRELCEYPELLERNRAAVEKLKLTLVARFGSLANESLGSELDGVLIERTLHWLAPFPEALKVYEQAVAKYTGSIFLRNALDDLRLSHELLIQRILANDKSLENQLPQLGNFIKQRGGSAELANMFVRLIDYYTKYQNTYVKHDDAVFDEEVEFVFELSSSLMKHCVRLSYRDAG